MVIEKVFGIQSTEVSLNERFTRLQSLNVNLPVTRTRKPINRLRNGRLIEHALQMELESKRRMFRQRLGLGNNYGLRRAGSDSNLSMGYRRSGSLSNLTHLGSVKSRLTWRGSNSNLSRAASFYNLQQYRLRGRGARLGFRRRGARGLLNGFRGARFGRVTGVAQRNGVWRSGGLRGRGRGATRGRGLGRGRGRGAMRVQKPPPTKEELDAQLDQYMACTKAALDQELDTYMKNCMDIDDTPL